MSSIDITGAEDIMRVAVNEQTELNSLLSYYRSKIEDFSKERLEWIAKYDECKYQADLKQKLEWENRALKDKVQELEKALSHHRTALYDQRNNYLRLSRENSELKKKITQDAHKIQDLMHACEPNHQQMLQCREVRAELGTNYIVNELNIHKHGSYVEGKSRNTGTTGASTIQNSKIKKAIGSGGGAGLGTPGQSSIQNQSIPNERQSVYEMEIINLRKQYDAESANLRAQIQALKEEVSRIQQRAASRDDELSQSLKQVMESKMDLEKKHNNLAQEYFAVRLKLNQNEQKVQEDNELLRVKNMYLAQSIKELERKQQRQQKAIEELVNKRNNDFKLKYKQDMRKKEEHLAILRQQYEKVQQIYLAKIKSLEEHLSKLNDKHNQLQQRYKRETDYFKSQLRIMEQRVQKGQVERMRLQIQQLEEEEKRKQQAEEEQARRQAAEAEARKNKKNQEIQKAYNVKQEGGMGKTKKKGRQPAQIQEEQEEESLDRSDIENIRRHIKELEQKLDSANS